MKLILFGGIQGVGKTTLLSCLERKCLGRIIILNSGELFRRYVYDQRIKIAEEVEEYLLETLLAMPDDSVVVLHWHYAVSRPDGYIPQISFSRLKRLAESRKIEQIILVSVRAPADVVRERRLADYQKKKRSLSLIEIQEEAAVDEEFLIQHRVLFSQTLGHNNVVVFRFVNMDSKIKNPILYDFFRKLLS